MKPPSRPGQLVIDELRSYRVALNEIGAEDRQAIDRWESSWATSSHQPYRSRDRGMVLFRHMHSLQEIAVVQSSVCNHFNSDRSLSSGNIWKLNRVAALSGCRRLCVD